MCMFNVNESQALQYSQRIKNLAKVRARERSERLISRSVRVHEMDEVNLNQSTVNTGGSRRGTW